MTSSVFLYDLVHCRSGDKGNDSLLAVIPYEPADYLQLIAALDASSIAAHFGVSDVDVDVNPAPAVGGVIVVVRGCLAEGVTRSVRADPHGKSMSSRLLMLGVEWPRPRLKTL